MNAIVLFSGGLDSLLTVRVLQEQNFNVIALNIVTPFHNGSDEAQKFADLLGIELVVQSFGDEYMRMLKNPQWGVGKNLNPCLDCRIMMCQAAKKLMEERQAEFVATGEISGQRPNSQKMHQLNLIASHSGLKGKLLRPLCAKVLPPTEAELSGIIDREKLHSFTGRHRGNLIWQAKNKYCIPIIPQPSTGCLLCEKSFVARISDLFQYKDQPTTWDANVLTVGRQLRLSPKVKCVVCRNFNDCQKMETLFQRSDRSEAFFMKPWNFCGAFILMIGDFGSNIDYWFQKAGALVLRFTNPEKYKNSSQEPIVEIFWDKKRLERSIVEDETVNEYKVITE
ncbi:MAG: tRNA 4-thiouridine(8) synthase ThiI [Planctomycetia bacterium]|nr:tRNA 4-thiouridine(8) synthase ThiI [Planctomycetia bacterium]